MCDCTRPMKTGALTNEAFMIIIIKCKKKKLHIKQKQKQMKPSVTQKLRNKLAGVGGGLQQGQGRLQGDQRGQSQRTQAAACCPAQEGHTWEIHPPGHLVFLPPRMEREASHPGVSVSKVPFCVCSHATWAQECCRFAPRVRLLGSTVHSTR